MTVLIHIYLIFGILMIGSDVAATDGQMIQELGLPGAWFMNYLPWLGVTLYGGFLLITRRSRLKGMRMARYLVAICMACLVLWVPMLILNFFAKRIEVSDFFQNKTMVEFRQKFETTACQYGESGGGPWIVVPKRKYVEGMQEWIIRAEFSEQKARNN